MDETYSKSLSKMQDVKRNPETAVPAEARYIAHVKVSCVSGGYWKRIGCGPAPLSSQETQRSKSLKYIGDFEYFDYK
jgi:hypothetical protein